MGARYSSKFGPLLDRRGFMIFAKWRGVPHSELWRWIAAHSQAHRPTPSSKIDMLRRSPCAGGTHAAESAGASAVRSELRSRPARSFCRQRAWDKGGSMDWPASEGQTLVPLMQREHCQDRFRGSGSGARDCDSGRLWTSGRQPPPSGAESVNTSRLVAMYFMIW
jgi:hypothetical protein